MSNVFFTFSTVLERTFFNKKLIKFTLFSGIGLSIDLFLFYILTQSGIYVVLSNIISSFIAVTFVYLTSTKFVHDNKTYSFKKFIYFTLYYSVSIIVFSFIIFVGRKLFRRATNISEISCCSTFTTNQLFLCHKNC